MISAVYQFNSMRRGNGLNSSNLLGMRARKYLLNFGFFNSVNMVMIHESLEIQQNNFFL